MNTPVKGSRPEREYALVGRWRRGMESNHPKKALQTFP
jgi:hypothetical protein